MKLLDTRTVLVLLTVALSGSLFGSVSEGQVRWRWAWGTEAGYFVTDGSLVGGVAPPGKYNVVDFAVTRSAYTGHVGAMSKKHYNEGSQPGTGLVWDGAKDTQWFRDGGRYTNGANYYGTTLPSRYLFAVGFYSVSSGSTLARSSTITLTPESYGAIQLSGAPAPGGTITIDLDSKDDAGKIYQLGSSLGTGPIPIGQRQLNLTPDGVFTASVLGVLPSVFANYANRLDASGKAQAKLNIPNIAALKGVRIRTAYVTLDAAAPNGIATISTTESFSIQ